MASKAVAQTRPRRKPIQRGGWVFALITFLVLASAWNTGINLLYIVLGMLTSFLLISIVFSIWTLARLRVTREGPEAVHRGQRFGVSVRIENRKALVPSIALRVESQARPGESAAFIVKIPPRKAARFRMSEVFEKRGVYPLPPIAVLSRFPFGLTQRTRVFHDRHEVVVYPRILAVRAAHLEQLHGVGEMPRTARGPGDEFFSLRDYMPGDDIRHIAWRSSARSGNLVVRELEQETSRNVLFVFDSCAVDEESSEEAFEDAVELVASLAVTLLHRQYTVGLVSRSVEVPEGEGKGQIRRLLEALARIEPTASEELGPLAHVPHGGNGKRLSTIVVSSKRGEWGKPSVVAGGRVLDPREVIRA
jgi:uncharacterized protein (DUF58 family)